MCFILQNWVIKYKETAEFKWREIPETGGKGKYKIFNTLIII